MEKEGESLSLGYGWVRGSDGKDVSLPPSLLWAKCGKVVVGSVEGEQKNGCQEEEEEGEVGIAYYYFPHLSFSIAAVLLLLFAAYCAVCSLLLLLLLSASASVRPSAVLHFLAFSLVRGGVNTNRESGFPPPLSLFPPSSHRVSSPSSYPSKRAEREANSSISPPSVLVGSQASTGKGRKEGNGVEGRRPFLLLPSEKKRKNWRFSVVEV